MKTKLIALSSAALLLWIVPGAQAQNAAHKQIVDASKAMVPQPPWPAGDERGMANGLGRGTWMRCAYHLGQAKAKSYELSHVRSNTMPLSPFGAPLKYQFNPTIVLKFTRHAFNGEKVVSGEPGAQGTQMDALGHFAVIPKAWMGKGKPPPTRRAITAATRKARSSRPATRRC